MAGNEKGMDEAAEDDFYGFGVDAGMGCVADKKSQYEYSIISLFLHQGGEMDITLVILDMMKKENFLVFISILLTLKVNTNRYKYEVVKETNYG